MSDHDFELLNCPEDRDTTDEALSPKFVETLRERPLPSPRPDSTRTVLMAAQENLLPSVPSVPARRWRWAISAVAASIMGTGVFLLLALDLKTGKVDPTEIAKPDSVPAVPGADRAILAWDDEAEEIDRRLAAASWGISAARPERVLPRTWNWPLLPDQRLLLIGLDAARLRREAEADLPGLFQPRSDNSSDQVLYRTVFLFESRLKETS